MILEKWRKVFYTRLWKSLYGCLFNTILFCQPLLTNFEDFRINLNPYYPCVYNKLMNYKQFSIVCHLDDFNLSHKEPAKVTKIP